MGNNKLAGRLVVFIILLTGCATTPVLNKNNTQIAVWGLADYCLTGDSAYADIGELLTAKVIETIKSKGEYQIVERERLLLALEELNLGTTSLVDEATRLEIGKMLGAQLMVFGGYQVIDETARLDLRVVEVETGKIFKAAQQTFAATSISNWLEAVDKVTSRLF